MPRHFLILGLVGLLVGGRALIAATADTSTGASLNPASHADVDLLVDSRFAQKRIADLRAQIAHHDALYFQQAQPEITDAAYDALKRELHALEVAFPAEAAAAPQRGLSSDDHTDGFAKVAHREPMLSLDKAYTEMELRAFCSKIETTLGHPADFVVEPKIDGLSINATYERGKFVRASTRGNGHEGDDITASARMIRSLPHELRAFTLDGTPNAIPDVIELRGEIYLSRAEFDRLNREREAEGEVALSHPRNVAAGAIKSRDPNETADRHLAVVFYGWGNCEPASTLPSTQQAFHSQAKAWGLPILETYQVVHDADGAWAAVQALGQEREMLAAPTDGAVLKLDAIAARAQFGESDHAPRWALAFKFSPKRAVTRLRAITLQVGRTGILTPVAELDPVALGGSTISRATLHNRDQIKRLDLRVGDFVILEKAGEIIPEIVGLDSAKRPADSVPYVFPEKCPVCGATVVVDPAASAVRCPNQACPAQLQRRIAHFTGKAGVEIKGLGPSIVAELVARGELRSVADLYRLTEEQLRKVPGVGAKSAARLYAEIECSRHAETWRLINGLSIPHVGPASAKLLARHFVSLEKLASAQPEDFPVELGGATTQMVISYFAEAENRALVLALAKIAIPAMPTATEPPAEK